MAAGACAGSVSGAAFAALLGLPIGAFFGFVNLLLVHSLTKEAKKTLEGAAASGGVEEDERPPYYLNLYALVGAIFAVIANFVFLLPHARQMHGQYGNVLATTSALCGGVGLYFGKKIARTRSRGKAAHLGALGGLWIGGVNGTVVFPIIGTIIGGVLGAIIGGIFGGPLAFYLINVAKWLLRDDGGSPADRSPGSGTEEVRGTPPRES